MAVRPPIPFVLGLECAGVINSTSPIPPGCPFKTGGRVSTFPVTRVERLTTNSIDRVFGFAQGSYAEHVVANPHELNLIPDEMSFEDAAVLSMCVVQMAHSAPYFHELIWYGAGRTYTTSYHALVRQAQVRKGP